MIQSVIDILSPSQPNLHIFRVSYQFPAQWNTRLQKTASKSLGHALTPILVSCTFPSGTVQGSETELLIAMVMPITLYNSTLIHHERLQYAAAIRMLTFYLAASFIVTVLFIRRLCSPIAKLPGPWYTTFTSWVLKYHEFTSNRRLYIHDLHKKYGTTVRIAPNEVSFASLEAIKEIYASGGSGYDKTELYDLFRQFGIKYEVAEN